MQDGSTARFTPVFRSKWLALWLVLGCGGAGGEEMVGDPVTGVGPTGAASAVGASAAVSGNASLPSPAAASSNANAANGSAGANSGGGANHADASSAASPNSACGSAVGGMGRSSAGAAGGASSWMSRGSAGAAGGPDAACGSSQAGDQHASGASDQNNAGDSNGASDPKDADTSNSGMNDAGAANSGGGPNTAEAGAGSAGSRATSGAAGSGMMPTSNTPLTVYIASDSTASNYKDTGSDKDQAGWGQMLPEFVKPNAKVDNRAIGGRTARRFIDEGSLDKIWADIQTGDYLLVQFGTNDGNKTATYELNGQQIPYYLDPQTDFKTYIKKYIQGAQEHGAVPVLVTPPPRNSAYCTGGNGTGAHAQALRELGESEQVLVVDLNQKTVDYLKAICPEPSPPDFFLQKPDGSVDGTHFQERGARKLASFVAEGLRSRMVSWVKD